EAEAIEAGRRVNRDDAKHLGEGLSCPLGRLGPVRSLFRRRWKTNFKKDFFDIKNLLAEGGSCQLVDSTALFLCLRTLATVFATVVPPISRQ
ncbi:hypothetical protein, partial [Bradyrhizobium sp. CCBAU 51745]|uniref:hypothetical protein n=1 Tax=Bradyrhizobium sp. CCBAU 51745 TaxID=1325099 RepID=UPI0023054644